MKERQLRKNDIVLFLLVLSVFYIIPHSFVSSNFIYSILFYGIVVLWLFFVKKEGFSIVFISVIFCIPQISDDARIDLLKSNISLLYFFNRVIILGMFIGVCMKKVKIPFFNVNLLLLVLFILIMSICHSIVSGYPEYMLWLDRILLLFLFASIVYVDRMEIVKMLFFIDVIMGITFVYVLLDFFFIYSPYAEIYESSYANFYEDRAKGLLGHPLILSIAVIFYQILLFSRIVVYKEKLIIPWLVCIFLTLFSVSRTPVLTLGICFFLYIINTSFNTSLFSKIKRVFSLLGLIAVIIVSGYVFEDYVQSIFYRFSTTEDPHRLAVYDTVLNIVDDYPFGVGENRLLDIAYSSKYSEYGLLSFVRTLDNFFATFYGSYGVLFIFPVCFYYYYFYNLFKDKNVRKNNIFRTLIVPLYLNITFLGFIVSFESYTMFLVLIAVFIAVFYKELEKQERFIVSN
jgi:hypothetical protein